MRLAAMFAVTLFAATAVGQEDKVACRKAFEQAQSLRDDGKLTAAREQMLICSRACPAGFAKVCDGWLVDVEKALPSIVVRVVDESGQDLVHVNATLDGAPLEIDGKSVAVDPGTHVVKLSAPGRPSVVKELVASQGEQNRVVVIAMPAERKPAPSPARVEASPPIAAYVVTGIGVAALGGFAYFGLSADARHRELVDGCSKTASCSADDRDRVVRDWRIADAFLVSSVVLVGVGAYLYFSHDKTTVAVAPTASGARAALTITF